MQLKKGPLVVTLDIFKYPFSCALCPNFKQMYHQGLRHHFISISLSLAINLASKSSGAQISKDKMDFMHTVYHNGNLGSRKILAAPI